MVVEWCGGYRIGTQSWIKHSLERGGVVFLRNWAAGVGSVTVFSLIPRGSRVGGKGERKSRWAQWRYFSLWEIGSECSDNVVAFPSLIFSLVRRVLIWAESVLTS